MRAVAAVLAILLVSLPARAAERHDAFMVDCANDARITINISSSGKKSEDDGVSSVVDVVLFINIPSQRQRYYWGSVSVPTSISPVNAMIFKNPRNYRDQLSNIISRKAGVAMAVMEYPRYMYRNNWAYNLGAGGDGDEIHGAWKNIFRSSAFDMMKMGLNTQNHLSEQIKYEHMFFLIVVDPAEKFKNPKGWVHDFNRNVPESGDVIVSLFDSDGGCLKQERLRVNVEP